MIDAQTGLTAALDYQDNVYISGQYLNGGERGFFCTKLLATNGSVDSGNFAAGSSGLFKTANFAEFDGNNMQTYMSVYEYNYGTADVQNVQMVSRGMSSQIVIQQLNIDGTADSTFGSSGKVVNTITGLDSVGNAERNEEGNLFVGGTRTNGTKTTFLVRYKDDGAIDTNFGDVDSGSKTGFADLDPTDTWILVDGGFFFIDSGGAIPVAFIEQRGANRRLIVERVPGTDDFEFDVSTASAKGLDSHIQAKHFNDKNRLWHYIGVDAIVADLQTTWEAVGAPLDSITITKGINLFKSAMNIVLGFVVERATKNSFASCLALPNKPGPMNKQMQKLMNKVENSFTQDQLDAMDAGVNAAFDKVFTKLNGGRENVTGNKRHSKKSQ